MINKNLIFGLFMISTSFLAGCDNSSSKENAAEEINTPSGLKILITKKGDGPKPQRGNIVKANYTGKLQNKDSTVFDSSVQPGREPFVFTLGEGQVIKGWDEGFALLNVGSKATFIIPPQLGYGEKGAGNVIPPNATLFFDVELLEIIEKKPPFNFDVTGKERIKTPSGLEYVIIEQGSGVKVDSGSEVQLHYTGRLSNDSIFDSSPNRGVPITFRTKSNMVIPGFDEGVSALKVGDKARLFIPYQIGYGDRELPGLPAKSNLIFDVQILNVKK